MKMPWLFEVAAIAPCTNIIAFHGILHKPGMEKGIYERLSKHEERKSENSTVVKNDEKATLVVS